MNTVGHKDRLYQTTGETATSTFFVAFFSFVWPVERETRARFGYISLSFVLSYRTTRNHVVISSRENERKTHYYYYYYYS